MSRLNRFLIGLLAVQVVVIGLGLAFCGGEGTRRAARVLLLEGVDREQLDRIYIEDGEGRSATLVRAEDGWVLEEQAGYPADTQRVEQLLGTLLGLESSYIVSRSGAHRVALEVAPDEFRRKVEIDAAGERRVLLVGDTARTGLVHVSLADQTTIYAVDELTPWKLPTGVRDWARKEYLDIDAHDVLGVQIERGGQESRLVRTGAEGWRMEPAGEQALDPAKVDDLLDNLLDAAPTGVRGRWSEAQVREAVADHPDRVRLVLELRETAAGAEKASAGLDGGRPGGDGLPPVPPPAPIATGSADAGVPVDGGVSGPHPGEATTETRAVILAPHPDKDTAALLYAEGAEHVIEVDRWRVAKLLSFEPSTLAPGEDTP